MRPIRFAVLVVSAAAAVCAAPASAVTCYRLIDRNDNVVYQDIFPPVDLSDQGEAERKVLRQRGEHMIAMEADRCPRLEFMGGAGTGTRIDLEEMGEPKVAASVKPGSEKSGATPVKRSPKPASKAAPAKSPTNPG